MKELWCSESCRMVRVSPSPPKQHLLVGEQAAQPHRVHGHPVHVGAAGAVQAGGGRVGLRGAAPASLRAAAMSWAVRAAVPLGASALLGWCSSTTSADSKKRAACWAKRMVSTAPMAKFGAMSTPVPGEAASQPRSGRQPLLGPAGGADHGVDAVPDAVLQVAHDGVGVGQVDRDLGARARSAPPVGRRGRARRPAPCRRRPRRPVRPRSRSGPRRRGRPHAACSSFRSFADFAYQGRAGLRAVRGGRGGAVRRRPRAAGRPGCP